MKRNLLPLIILLYAVYGLYSQEAVKDDFEFKLNYGSLGWGMNVFSNDYDFEVSASLINFFMEHDKTNMGLEISPFKYMADYSVYKQVWNHNVYFLNGNLYWNPFDIKGIILGPFVSINYLNVENMSKFHTDEYIFSTGFRFLLRTFLNDGAQPFEIIGSEIGYKNISGKHGFYFNVNTDITVLASLLLLYGSSYQPPKQIR